MPTRPLIVRLGDRLYRCDLLRNGDGGVWIIPTQALDGRPSRIIDQETWAEWWRVVEVGVDERKEVTK